MSDSRDIEPPPPRPPPPPPSLRLALMAWNCKPAVYIRHGEIHPVLNPVNLLTSVEQVTPFMMSAELAAVTARSKNTW